MIEATRIYFQDLGWLGTSLWSSFFHILPIIFIGIASGKNSPMSVYLFWFLFGAVIYIGMVHTGWMPTSPLDVSPSILLQPAWWLLIGTTVFGFFVGGSYITLLVQGAEKAALVGVNPTYPFGIMIAGLIVPIVLLGLWKFGFKWEYLLGVIMVVGGVFLIKNA